MDFNWRNVALELFYLVSYYYMNDYDCFVMELLTAYRYP